MLDQTSKKLYWVTVRHVGGAAERECVMRVLVLASDKQSAFAKAQGDYLDWIGSRLELSADEPDFVEAP